MKTSSAIKYNTQDCSHAIHFWVLALFVCHMLLIYGNLSPAIAARRPRSAVLRPVQTISERPGPTAMDPAPNTRPHEPPHHATPLPPTHTCAPLHSPTPSPLLRPPFSQNQRSLCYPLGLMDGARAAPCALPKGHELLHTALLWAQSCTPPVRGLISTLKSQPLPIPMYTL